MAVGQFTPGPVFTTATFVGYLIAGGPGAVVATVGIFLPGFLLVAAMRPLLDPRPPFARDGPAASTAGVNVAALALMAVVTVQLARAALVDAVTVAIAPRRARVSLLRFLPNTTWLVVGGAVVGVLVRAVR